MAPADDATDAQDLAVTIWVGKAGIDPVVDELATQLADRPAVKIRFLRSALAGTTTERLADQLAERAEADVRDVRGHTTVIGR